MSKFDGAAKLARAAAARTTPTADTAAPAVTGSDHTTTTTVKMSKYLRAEMDAWAINARRDSGLPAKRLGIGPVSVALYEAFLADPDLQKEILRRLA